MLVNELVSNLNLLSSGTQPVTHLWLYGVVVLVVMLEGPFTILLASSAASTGVLEPIPVFAAASLGNLLADSLWYMLGYYGRLDIVLRWRFLKINPVSIELLKEKMHRHAIKILLVAKMTNGMIVPALIATGVARVPLRKWFPVIFFSNLLVTGSFVALGYFTAVNILKLNHWIRYLVLGVSLLFFAALSIYIQRLIRKQISVESITEMDQPVSEKKA